MHIVLHQPEIPQNTGNIGRTCVATGTSLHLIEPLGFRINEKELKRAGMDYWEKLDVTRYIDYEDFTDNNLVGPYDRDALSNYFDLGYDTASDILPALQDPFGFLQPVPLFPHQENNSFSLLR